MFSVTMGIKGDEKIKVKNKQQNPMPMIRSQFSLFKFIGSIYIWKSVYT